MSIKNNFILILLFLITLSCKSQEQQIERVDIKFVNINTETPFQITSKTYESFFKDEVDSISIQDYKQLEEFRKIIKSLDKADSSKYSSPDVRIIIRIFYNDKRTIYMYMDRFVVSRLDKIYISTPLLRYIQSIIELKRS